MTQQNIADLREEWVYRCGSGKTLSGYRVRLQSGYPELKDVLSAILRAHGAAVTESDPQYLVVLDTEPQSRGEKVLVISTHTKPPRAEGHMILHSPAIYGAALPDDCGCNDAIMEDHEISAIHCTELFRHIVAALAEFRPGICSIPPEDPHRKEELQILRLLRQYPQRRFYDDTSYGGQLRQLQLTQLECLLELDRICRENKISYFLGGGTLLGAVRHKGFIPWDDDIDVMMTRENFDRFAAVAPNAVGTGFFYQDCNTDPQYHSPFTKLRKNGTKFTTAFSSRFSNTHNGVFLDIFAHDAAPKQKILLKLHIFLTRFARSLVFHKWADTPMHFYGKMKFLCRIADRIKRGTPMHRLETFQRWVMTFWNKRHTGWMYDGMGEHLSHGCFPARLLEESIEAEFEGHRFPIPKEYDEYLKFSYGENYISWPRPGQRNSHHAAVEFSLSSGESE